MGHGNNKGDASPIPDTMYGFLINKSIINHQLYTHITII